MVWIKGPRCGIDNCASAFYQVLSGQRVCQYGHVQIGLETTGDDDDFVAMGQRIARSKFSEASQLAKPAKESNILRGRSAKLKTIELLQEVFQHQVKYVSESKQLSASYEKAARYLWGLFLNSKKMSSVGLLDLVALAYLATRLINYPLLLVDFNLWIKSTDFPYFGSWRVIDKAKYETLPGEYRKQFQPTAEPGAFALHKTTKTIKKTLETQHAHLNLKFLEIDDRYVCFRMCQSLMFAPQIYVGALRLLKVLKDRRAKGHHIFSYGEEVPASCAVIVAAKLYYGMDGLDRDLPSNRKGNEFDWQVWRDLMRKLWLMHPDFGRADERLVQYWSEEDMDAYLSWFQLCLGVGNELDKRLATIFPTVGADFNSISNAPAGTEVIHELCALLHSTEGIPSNIKWSPNRPKVLPGSQYQAYSVRIDSSDELPEMVGVLYNLISHFLGTDEYHIRQIVRKFEKIMKAEHPTLLAKFTAQV